MRGCPNMLSAGLGANSCNSFQVLCRKFANQVPGCFKTTPVASCELEGKVAGLQAQRRSRPAPQRKPRRSRGGGCESELIALARHGMEWYSIA